MRHAKCYTKGYPRPQFVREEFCDLSGAWAFSFDDKREGERNRWFCAFPAGKTIIVPFAYQTEKSGVNERENHDCVWYEREAEYS